ncbi:Lysophosphatidic acid acyltransferase LPAAT and related acyltransferases [Phaffia rhodozyma]|uniref:Lysophosphatidic acid acyltransferase LPAAT and related acyltransferases n=1 Tax=Phaffia rhodozyma TaxID=264483 RepID=A0A0F7SEG8_PHARH|nr:Lysophosphatidic acid acyltransferase LPAAT and related acyltransferases [Phaffia rhodozyma]
MRTRTDDQDPLIPTSTARSQLWTVPIKDRPKSHGSWFSYIVFPIVFNIGILSINTTQLLCWPLAILPPTRPLYYKILRSTKSSWCSLILLISILFGPTSLVLTAGEGIDLDDIVVRRDKTDDRVIGLDLPKRAVVMGNHQAYTDWLYIWVLGYFAGTADGVYILLKKSLKWIPFVGWGCQFFDFLFLARRWAQDKGPLFKYLNRLSTESVKNHDPIWMMVFPEGTIVSDQERANSSAYAKKQDIDDTINVLLPHSLGLQTILHQLSQNLPSLPVLDITIGYPGVPPAGAAQEYHNLFSIFHRSVPPPAVHMHLRMYDSAQIPLGAQGGESTSDREAFGAWLLERWREKDRLMAAYYRDGVFPTQESEQGVQGGSIEVPVRFRSNWEAGNALCWGFPLVGLPVVWGILGWGVWKLVTG